MALPSFHELTGSVLPCPCCQRTTARVQAELINGQVWSCTSCGAAGPVYRGEALLPPSGTGALG